MIPYRLKSVSIIKETTMKTLGNIIWFLFGGVFMGLMWWFFGLLAS
ncbi:hypothetical protein JCM19233_4323 [Vibrio astriarenae]|nr:hypothetical protein JCM19233_4323 [Vibrio sp. C7]